MLFFSIIEVILGFSKWIHIIHVLSLPSQMSSGDVDTSNLLGKHRAFMDYNCWGEGRGVKLFALQESCSVLDLVNHRNTGIWQWIVISADVAHCSYPLLYL